jgi:hypothetical protein
MSRVNLLKLSGTIISRSFLRSLLSILFGGLLGFLYFYFVGCNAGSCSITSDPYASIITGGLLGFLIRRNPENDKTKEKTIKK